MFPYACVSDTVYKNLSNDLIFPSAFCHSLPAGHHSECLQMLLYPSGTRISQMWVPVPEKIGRFPLYPQSYSPELQDLPRDYWGHQGWEWEFVVDRLWPTHTCSHCCRQTPKGKVIPNSGLDFWPPFSLECWLSILCFVSFYWLQ